MATTPGVQAALRTLAERINRDPNTMVDKLSATWLKLFGDIEDAALMSAAKRWSKPRLPLIGEIEELLGPARKSSWAEGCNDCRGSGMRVVIRHVHGPGRPFLVQEAAAACTCTLGRDFTAKRGQLPFGELRDRWLDDMGTLDRVVVVDPEPLHRHPRQEWADRKARAEANTEAVLAYLAPQEVA